MLQVYYGDGKGKTTAAVGCAVRAAGAGRHVIFTQFLKNGSSNELKPLEHLGAEIFSTETHGFTFMMSEAELADCAKKCCTAFSEAANKIKGTKNSMVIFDELLDAVCSKLISEEAVLAFLSEAPDDSEIIITGHSLVPSIADCADYITEIKKVKHPYDKGVTARNGIEY